MKSIVKRISLGLALVTLFSVQAMGQARIATIDLRKVFDNYWKRQQAEAALKDRGAGMDKELKGFLDDYKKGQDDYNKLLAAANDQSVTPEERDKRKSAAEDKFKELKTSENTIQTFENNAREQLDSQKKRMRESILDDIRTAVNAKAKIGGYSLVIDVAAESINSTPVVLYTTGETDLTDAILAQLNAAAPPPSSDASKPTDSGTGNKKP